MARTRVHVASAVPEDDPDSDRPLSEVLYKRKKDLNASKQDDLIEDTGDLQLVGDVEKHNDNPEVSRPSTKGRKKPGRPPRVICM
jgi:hypothetical protein